MNANQLAQVMEYECTNFAISKDEVLQAVDQLNDYSFGKLVTTLAQVDFLNGLKKPQKVIKIAYPYGQTSLETKIFECKCALREPLAEIEFVLNHSFIKNQDYEALSDEIYRLTEYCHRFNIKVKALLETSILSKDEIAKTARVLKKTDIDYLKLGILLKVRQEDIVLLKTILFQDIKIVVNNVDSFQEAFLSFKNGAKRIASNNPIKIIKEFKEKYES